MNEYWTPAYIALGSNLDEPRVQIQAAFDALSRVQRSRMICRSRWYETRPVGPPDQPDFINAAAALLTQLTARQLLEQLQQIEQAMGKLSPALRWGARRIDLDLLVFGAQRSDEQDLRLPHPGVPTRNFVLYPLLDIAPELSIPGHGRVRDLAQRVSAAGIAPLDSR